MITNTKPFQMLQPSNPSFKLWGSRFSQSQHLLMKSGDLLSQLFHYYLNGTTLSISVEVWKFKSILVYL